MPQEPLKRNAIMGDVLNSVLKQGYIYDLSKGFSKWPVVPPPRGTRINCQAASELAKRMAEEVFGMDGSFLKVVSAKPKNGFIVLASSGMKALGTSNPDITSGNISCWEFDNHYRVKDPIGFNKVYDPIFGTSGNFNPDGVKASSETVISNVPGGIKQVTEYGEKYRVTRGIGVPSSIEVINNGTIPSKYILTDDEFE